MATILLKTGSVVRKQIHIVGGACFAGEPTAFVVLYGKTVWVVPGQSVEFMEA